MNRTRQRPRIILSKRRHRAAWLVGFVCATHGVDAFAAPIGNDPVMDTKTDQASKLFGDGVASVQKFQWAEALSSFEQSYAIIPNAITSLNIGVCERALGRYVRARRSLDRALAENESGGGHVLSATSIQDAKSYLGEIAGLLVHARVKVIPREATIAVDGRPVVSLGDKQPFAAGLEPSGAGKAVPAEAFDLVLDPGNHVFVLSRKGFTDAVVNKSFAAGATTELTFELEKLPATLKITSAVTGAIVRVSQTDVGPVPVDVLRPAGTYPVVVQKDGYDPYAITVTIRPGEETKINAVLPKTKMNVAKQWWFWTSVAGALGTAGVITYFAARPAPESPPYKGGSTGWVVSTGTSFRF